MKEKLKKIIALAAVFALSAILLASCKIGGGSGNTDGAGDGSSDDGSYIFNSDTSVNIIVNDTDFSGEAPNNILTVLYRVLDSNPAYGGDELESTGHEIIIGPSEREVSKLAYHRLSRIERIDADERYMLIYSDGNSVAIAYDPDYRGVAATLATDWLIENYIEGNNSLKLRRGVVYRESFDIDEEFTRLDDEYRDVQWAMLEAHIGGEEGKAFVEAMKEHYSIYDDRVFSWLANLYEPTIGAFYYSNSARDTVGFLPDVESTVQALSFIENVGALDQYYGGDYMNVISEEHKTKLFNWVRGLQSSEDGYFYHPQWGVNITENRRARDLNWCVRLIRERYGEKPLYNTPGNSGDGITERGTAAAALTGTLGNDAVVAVSAVIATASVNDFPEYIRTTQAWEEYLESLDLRYNSYYVCNLMSTLTATINKRDNLSESEGEGRPFRKIELDWLIRNQNPETGCWDWNDPTSENFRIYDGPNGLLKIFDTFNAGKIVIPYADRALESCVAAIASDEPIGGITDIYNAYWAMAGVCQNMRKHGSDEDAAFAQATVKRLLTIAPAAIRGTTDKIIEFKKDDGSFSYGRQYSSSTSQGVTVCLSYQVEGDVNGNGIAISGVTSQMFSAFGLDNFKPIIFGDNCQRRFFDIIYNLGPVIKDEGIDNREPVTFDDEVVGEEPDGVSFTLGGAEYGSYVKILADPRPDAKGNVLDYYSAGTGGDTVRVDVTGNIAGASCYVFQGDFCINKATTNWKMAFNMERTYGVTFRFDGDNVEIWDSSSEKAAYGVRHHIATAKLGEWFTLRLEYYLGDADTVRCIAYFNGEVVSVNDNHYDLDGAKLKEGSEPKIGEVYNFASLYIPNGYSGHLYADNLYAYKTNDVYEPITDPENQPAFNIDAPDKDRVSYGFEESTDIPEELNATAGGGVLEVVSGADGNALSLSGAASGNAPKLYLATVQRTQATKTALFEADILIPEDAEGNLLRIIFGENNAVGATAAAFDIKTVGEGEEKYAVICPSPTGVQGSPIGGIALPIGEAFRLRIDVSVKPVAATVYINGEPVAITDSLTSVASICYIERVTLQGFANATSKILLDNLVAERIRSNADDMTEVEVDTVVHKFSGGFGKVTYEGGASVSGGSVKLSAPASITVPFNQRSVLTSFNLVEAHIRLTSVKNGEKLYEIRILDGKGATVLAYEVRADENGEAGLYEVTEYGVCESPILTLSASSVAKLRFEHYATEGMTLIYVGSRLSAMSGLYYSEATASSKAHSLVITSFSGSMSVDNVVADTYYNNYVAPDFETVGGTSENGAEKLTFETSSTGVYPSALTLNLATSGAEGRIEGAFKRGVFGKVVSLSSTAGTGDAMLLSVTKPAGKGEVVTGVAFESDLLFKSGQNGVLFQLSLGGTAGAAYMFNVSLSSDGYVNLVETSHTTDSAKRQETVVSGRIPIDSWFNLRIEYYYGDKDGVRICTYLDGELHYVSTNYYDSHKSDTPKDGLTYARISALNSTVATVKADNMLLEELTAPFAPPNPSQNEKDYYGKGAYVESSATRSYENIILGYLSSTAKSNLSFSLANGVSSSESYVFEADIRLTDLAYTESLTWLAYITMFGRDSSLTDGNLTTEYARPSIYSYKGKAYLSSTTGTRLENGAVKEGTYITELEADVWYNIRLEVNQVQNPDGITTSRFVRFFVNGVQYSGDVAESKDGFFKAHFVRTVITKRVAFGIDVDNVFVGGVGEPRGEQMKNECNTVNYYGKGVYIDEPGAEKYSDKQGGFLTLPLGYMESHRFVAVKDGGLSASVDAIHVFETDIRLSDFQRSDTSYWHAYFTFYYQSGVDGNGEPTYAKLQADSSRISISTAGDYGYLMFGTSAADSDYDGEVDEYRAKIALGVWNNLRIEQHREASGEKYSTYLKIYFNGEYLGRVSSGTYGELYGPISHVALATRRQMTLDFDNTFVGTVIPESTHPEDGSETVDFEDSTAASLPGVLTYALSTVDSTVAVERVMNSRALVIRSAATSADSVSLSPTVSLEGASSARFSATYSLTSLFIGKVADIALTSGGAQVFRLELHRAESGVYTLRAVSKSGTSSIPMSVILTDGEAVDLALTYYENGGSPVVRVSLNGDTLADVSVVGGLPDKAQISLEKSAVAVLTLDNLSLVQGSLEYLPQESGDERDYYGKGAYYDNPKTEKYSAEAAGFLRQLGAQSLTYTAMNGRTKGDRVVLDTDLRIIGCEADGVLLTLGAGYTDSNETVPYLEAQPTVLARGGRYFLVLGSEWTDADEDGAHDFALAELYEGVWFNILIEIATVEAEGLSQTAARVFYNGTEVASVALDFKVSDYTFKNVTASGEVDGIVDFDNVYVGVFADNTVTPDIREGDGGSFDGSIGYDDGGWTK